jgi:tetratricopeptide (TPR) repeat protein
MVSDQIKFFNFIIIVITLMLSCTSGGSSKINVIDNSSPVVIDSLYNKSIQEAGQSLADGYIIDAKSLFGYAIKINPNRIEGIYGYGVCLLLLNSDANNTIDSVILLLNKVYQLDHSYRSVAYNLSVALYKKNKYLEALDCINTSIKLNNDDSQSYLHRAYIYFALKDLESACADFTKALNLGLRKDEVQKFPIQCASD